MNARRLRMEQALDALPELDDLVPLREALLDLSRADPDQAWADSQAHATVALRLADPERVDARIAEIAEQLRARTERILRHVVASLRALENGDAAETARELVAAGELEEGAWRLDQAERYYRKALEMGRKPRDRRGEGLALKRLGRLARARGELREALRLYRAGYEVSEAERDTTGMVVACQGLGNVYVDQGEWETAKEWYRRGLDHLPDRMNPQYLHLCNALSVVERRLGNLDESEAWLTRGEAAADQVEDAGAKGYLQHGRARLLVARGEPAEAEQLLRRMLEHEIDPIARLSALVNLAEALLLQRLLGEAQSALREAESLAVQYRAPRYLPHVYEQLGRVALARRDPEGFVFFEQALELIREHRLASTQHAAVQHAYALFEAELGSTESALARFDIARQQYRSIGARVEAELVEADVNALRMRIAPGAKPTQPDGTNEEAER